MTCTTTTIYFLYFAAIFVNLTTAKTYHQNFLFNTTVTITNLKDFKKPRPTPALTTLSPTSAPTPAPTAQSWTLEAEIDFFHDTGRV